MFESLGRAINIWMIATVVLIVVFFPLGMWKLIEIIMWLTQHIKIVP